MNVSQLYGFPTCYQYSIWVILPYSRPLKIWITKLIYIFHGHGTSSFIRTVEDQPESPRATSSRMPLTSSPIHTFSFGSPNMSSILGEDISMQHKAPEYGGYRADTQCTFCANRSTFLMAPNGDPMNGSRKLKVKGALLVS